MSLLITLTHGAALRGAALRGAGPASKPASSVAGGYVPVNGGWRIRITADPSAERLVPGTAIGVARDDARLHRRPLFLVYNEPRFPFDYHSAGGLLGHLFVGLRRASTSETHVCTTAL